MSIGWSGPYPVYTERVEMAPPERQQQLEKALQDVIEATLRTDLGDPKARLRRAREIAVNALKGK